MRILQRIPLDDSVVALHLQIFVRKCIAAPESRATYPVKGLRALVHPKPIYLVRHPNPSALTDSEL